MRLIHQPHDKLFKQSMSDLRVAREFFETNVPLEILRCVDLNTLRLEKHSFIDEHYKATEADIVYSLSIGDQLAYFYLLCENQSDIDDSMAFRLLIYAVRLMELHRKKYPGSPLPIVYPMVVYSGKKTWDAPLEIFDLFGKQADLARQVLLKPYQLIDLQRITDNELCQHRWSGLVQLALKYRQVRDFRRFLDIVFPWINDLAGRDGQNYALTVLRYAMHGMKDGDEQLLREKSNEYLSDTFLQGEVMTVAEQIEQRGIQRGIQKGEATMLTRLLACSFQDIPPAYQKQIEAADGETLLRWAERVLDAQKLEDVFA
jgi:recombination-promoting nuclease RpnB